MGFPKNYGRNPHKKPVSSEKKKREIANNQENPAYVFPKNICQPPVFPKTASLFPIPPKKYGRNQLLKPISSVKIENLLFYEILLCVSNNSETNSCFSITGIHSISIIFYTINDPALSIIVYEIKTPFFYVSTQII